MSVHSSVNGKVSPFMASFHACRKLSAGLFITKFSLPALPKADSQMFDALQQLGIRVAPDDLPINQFQRIEDR